MAYWGVEKDTSAEFKTKSVPCQGGLDSMGLIVLITQRQKVESYFLLVLCLKSFARESHVQ